MIVFEFLFYGILLVVGLYSIVSQQYYILLGILVGIVFVMCMFNYLHYLQKR